MRKFLRTAAAVVWIGLFGVSLAAGYPIVRHNVGISYDFWFGK